MTTEGQEEELSPQDKLAILREKLTSISEQMKNLPLGGDPVEFANLFKKQEELGGKIQKLQDSIKPSAGHGTTGEYSVSSTRKPGR